MAITDELRKKVDENIKEAHLNDYSFDNYDDEDLAGDMQAYAENCEDETYDDILAAVKEWREKNGRK